MSKQSAKPKKTEKFPDRPQEATISRDDFKFKKTRVKIVGIGDGGTKVAVELARELKGVEFLVANTDWQKSQRFPPGVKVLRFGEKHSHGLGTGMEPELGRAAALAEKERLVKLFQGTDICFLVACLGGGTGSGAVPVFAKFAKEAGALTIGVLTLPFRFEGEKKMGIARDFLEKTRPYLNATLVLPNEKIFQALDKDISFQDSFSAVNKVLAKSLEGLVGLIFQPGLINIDFADLRTVLEGKGKPAYLASVEFDRWAKSEEIRKKLFQNAFLSHNFRQSRQVLFNIISEAGISLDEVSTVSQLVFSSVHAQARIIFGVSFDKDLVGKTRVVLLCVGGRERNFTSLKSSKVGKKPVKKNKNKKQNQEPEKNEVKIRRNAIEVQAETKAEEENLAAKEKIWETPAILRKGLLT